MWQRAHVKSQVLSQRPGLRDGQAGPGAGAAGAGSFFSPGRRDPALLSGQATGGGAVGVGPGRGLRAQGRRGGPARRPAFPSGRGCARCVSRAPVQALGWRLRPRLGTVRGGRSQRGGRSGRSRFLPASAPAASGRPLLPGAPPAHRGPGREWGQWDKPRTPRTPKKSRHLFLREKAGNREGRATGGSGTARVLSKILKRPRHEDIRQGISDAISLAKTVTRPQGPVRWR